MRGVEGLMLAWARPGPRPWPAGCLGRTSAAMADPGGFCSWSLRGGEGRRQEKRRGQRNFKKRHFQNLLGIEP